MATTFPSIRPTSRRYQLPAYAVSELKSQIGTTTTRLWGSQPSNARLDLTFQNITDAKALLISQAYVAAKGPVDALTLPNDLFSGADTALRDYIKFAGSGITWHFTSEPPSIESVVNGISTVSVTLVGHLRA